MRLNRFIASSGVCSRRKADQLIAEGRVQVNGVIIQNFGYTVNSNDRVYLDGKLLQTATYQYLMLHKPAGYLTTMHDDRARRTIYSLLPTKFHHLRPVGRLDYDSTGLLLLSNDGNFIYRLTHPSIKVAKRYLVSAKGRVTAKERNKMRQGIALADGKIAFAKALLLRFHNEVSFLEITLYQGLNRQIRKMLEILGHPVITLQRVAHGPFTLGDLPEGKFIKIDNPMAAIQAKKQKK